jgi:pilus assembly protein CpaC
LKGVSITDAAVASASLISANQVLLNGLKAGNTTLFLWDDLLRTHSYDIQVHIDLAPLRGNYRLLFPGQNIQVSPSAGSIILSGVVSSPEISKRAEDLAKTESVPVVNMLAIADVADSVLESLRETLQSVFPKENIQLSLSGGSLVLFGTASSPEVAKSAEALAKTEFKDVANMLSAPAASDVVMLQVRFAEVQRSAIEELGMNLLSTGATNTIGAITTQQFGQIGALAGALPSTITKDGAPPQPNHVVGTTGRLQGQSPANFGLSDILNIFLFRPDLNLGLAIRALQQRNLLQILAEPNLLALSGKEAKFLAGGEFPIPVVQGGALSTVTIIFKQFGVQLAFTATTLSNGTIHLIVDPEVSSLDFANALTLSGFLVPAISSRKAHTEVELANGQSFAIAGLIDNRLTEIASKIPGLGDIPILGKMFRSRSANRSSTELLVLVTPQIVKPLTADQLPPTPGFPAPFLDRNKFDGKAGEIPAKKPVPPPEKNNGTRP